MAAAPLLNNPFVIAFLISLTGFLVLWPLSLWRRDASLVDLWWAPGIGLQVFILAEGRLDSLQLAALGLVVLWALRLGGYMSWRKWQEPGEDPRYAAMRARRGHSFWWKSLFHVFLLQAVVQWLIAWPVLALTTDVPLYWLGLAVLGLGVAAAGLVLEAVADWQLAVFRHRAHARGDKQALLTTGLFGVVRHPNYLGEMLFWWGIGLVCLAHGQVWPLISPLLISALLIWVSGRPMMAEHLSATRPGYAAYCQRVPAFWPRCQ